MFNLSPSADQVVYSVIAIAAIAVIAVMLIRVFRRNVEKPWPVFFVGLYNILLLLLFLLGIVTQVSSEGFGFLPLLALTLPWSGLGMWLLISFTGLSEHNFSGSGFDPTLLVNFIIFNVLAGPANSYILYSLLKRRQRKRAEEKAAMQSGF